MECVVEPFEFGPHPDDKPRSRGHHVGNIIRDISNRTIKKGKRRSDKELTPDELKRLGPFREPGFWGERLFEHEMRRRMIERCKVERGDHIITQTEIKRDGIFLTPDLFDLWDWILDEFKVTWRASWRAAEQRIEMVRGVRTPCWRMTRLDIDFWEYIQQIKAYCGAYGTDQARLFIFFVNGDYRESGPQPFIFHLRFLSQELTDGWDMIRNHRDLMDREARDRGESEADFGNN